VKPGFFRQIDRHLFRIGVVLLLSNLAVPAWAETDERTVGITKSIPFVVINHRGTPIKVERIQDTDNRVVDDFSKTSRPCPPFCIHPMQASPGVRTVGELELLDFLKQEVETERGLLVDARLPNWYNSETIPGAVNIPFVVFTKSSRKRKRILELLGIKQNPSGENSFSGARTLCLFCNGPWCDQSPRAIKSLIDAGYPPEKLLYYRGGMQSWKLLGLTTILPTSNVVQGEHQ
jgi:rhodanese-related sulfurtransferase